MRKSVVKTLFKKMKNDKQNKLSLRKAFDQFLKVQVEDDKIVLKIWKYK